MKSKTPTCDCCGKKKSKKLSLDLFSPHSFYDAEILCEPCGMSYESKGYKRLTRSMILTRDTLSIYNRIIERLK